MSKYYDDTVELAYMMTQWAKSLKKPNKFIVCSGGGPGIMEAANRGAAKAKGFSMGLNISLPFEQYPNRYISPELNFEFHYFFMRKFWFAYLAKALVIMPGGFGTLDELMEILTLVQTEKLHKKMTVVVYGKEFWDKIINMEKMAELQVISPEDLKLFRFVNTPKEAFEYLKDELTKHYVIK
ncbi:MAG: TIGR00730 family Rossman fold protein [Ignavibacteria bacterium]|nr:TIGR00730 family Rossman fold protein [Ignavibacteria bacterium]